MTQALSAIVSHLRHDDAGAERHRVHAWMGASDHLGRHGQHGGVAEMEQNDGAQEHDQAALAEQLAHADGLLAYRTRLGFLAAACQFVVNVSWTDAEDRHHHAHREDANQIENPIIAPDMAAGADQDGGG
jgi:hypothetical protein